MPKILEIKILKPFLQTCIRFKIKLKNNIRDSVSKHQLNYILTTLFIEHGNCKMMNAAAQYCLSVINNKNLDIRNSAHDTFLE